MSNRQLTEIAIDLFNDMQKEHYKHTEDIKEAIKFNRAKYLGYDIDNCLYDDIPEAEKYTKLIDCRLRDICLTVDNDSLVVYEGKSKQPICIYPLSSISNINYLYYNTTFDLVFTFADSYLVDMTFEGINYQ